MMDHVSWYGETKVHRKDIGHIENTWSTRTFELKTMVENSQLIFICYVKTVAFDAFKPV